MIWNFIENGKSITTQTGSFTYVVVSYGFLSYPIAIILNTKYGQHISAGIKACCIACGHPKSLEIHGHCKSHWQAYEHGNMDQYDIV